MTFNTGTTKSESSVKADEGVFSREDWKLTDRYYGNGLAWWPAVKAAQKYIQEAQPDIIGFQEIFHPEKCIDIPLEAHRGFICETWRRGDPTVAEFITGEKYQVACHQGAHHKCIAVKRSFASIRGCHKNPCLDFLEGESLPKCSGASRLGRAILDLQSGISLTLVHVHATSGLSKKDKKYRKKQFRKIFQDFGYAQPAANGKLNLIIGDFNTDPKRMPWFDKSAKKLKKFAKKRKFHFLNGRGKDKKPTYKSIVTVDHILSDKLDGHCHSPGVTKNTRPVLKTSHFDHKPLFCRLNKPQ